MTPQTQNLAPFKNLNVGFLTLNAKSKRIVPKCETLNLSPEP